MIDWGKYPNLNRMWETRGARFSCHDRLTKTNVWVNYAIATGSAYVIFMSLIGMLNLNMFGVEDYKIINISSVVISVVIIFLSLIEGGKNYVLHAEAMHTCAREVNNIYHRAEAKIYTDKGEGTTDINDLTEEYDRVIDKCSFNHDKLDFDFFKTSKRNVYTDLTDKEVNRILWRRRISIYGSFFMMLFGIPSVLAVVWLLSRIVMYSQVSGQ